MPIQPGGFHLADKLGMFERCAGVTEKPYAPHTPRQGSAPPFRARATRDPEEGQTRAMVTEWAEPHVHVVAGYTFPGKPAHPDNSGNYRQQMYEASAMALTSQRRPVLTRTSMSRGLRTARTWYAYQPPACRTHQRHRAACLRGPTHCAYAVRVPAPGVRAEHNVPRTVAPQAAPWQEAARAVGGDVERRRDTAAAQVHPDARPPPRRTAPRRLPPADRARADDRAGDAERAGDLCTVNVSLHPLAVPQLLRARLMAACSPALAG